MASRRRVRHEIVSRTSPRHKWWRPKSTEETDKFESIKSRLLQQLQSSFFSAEKFIPISDITKRLKEAVGQDEAEIHKLGFRNLGDLLYHCDDFVQLRIDSNNQHYVSLACKTNGLHNGHGNLDLVHKNSLPQEATQDCMQKTEPVRSEKFLELFAENYEESLSVQVKRGGYRFAKGGSRGRSRGTDREPLIVRQRGSIKVPAYSAPSIVTGFSNGSHNAMSVSNDTDLISKQNDSTMAQRFLQAPQMKLLTDKAFPANIIGADGYGFIYIQVDNPAINLGYEQLAQQIHYYYSTPENQVDFKINQDDIHVGLVVVIRTLDGKFLRARIYDADLSRGSLRVVYLEDQTFDQVKLEDTFRIDRKFAIRCPRAVMCCLSGLEPFMMTADIAEAFQKAPLYPTKVNVQWLEQSKLFHVPVVKMTNLQNQDIAHLIKIYGWFHLKEPQGKNAKTEWPEMQARHVKALCQKGYIVVAP